MIVNTIVNMIVIVIATLVALMSVYILFLHFPRKCEKCGKFTVWILRRTELFDVYTGKDGNLVEERHYYRKKCLSCEFIGEEHDDYVSQTWIKGIDIYD